MQKMPLLIWEIYQKRISKVYDHDGPGFSYNIYGTEEYERIVNSCLLYTSDAADEL